MNLHHSAIPNSSFEVYVALGRAKRLPTAVSSYVEIHDNHIGFVVGLLWC